MITLKQWMEVVDYRVTEGSDFTWNCFGADAKPYCLTAWDGDYEGSSANIVFDTDTQTVYMVEVCDYKNERAYRLINPEWASAHNDYGKVHYPESFKMAWDNVDFVELETEEDWLEKAQAIVDGVDYDTRVRIPLEFSNEELLKYMTLAHERDMTFNDFIAEALQHVINEHKQDPEGMKSRAEQFSQRHIEPHGY